MGCRGPHQAGQRHEAHGAGDAFGLPAAAHTTSASPAEATLVPATLEARFTLEQPERVIGEGLTTATHSTGNAPPVAWK